MSNKQTEKIQAVIDALYKREEAQREIDKLSRQKAKAQARKDAVMRDGIISDAELPELSQVQLIIDLASPRIARCERTISEIEKELGQMVSNAASEWNPKVRDLVKSIQDEIVAATSPFFSSAERARRFLIKETVPWDSIRAVTKAFWSASPGADAVPADFYYKLAINFLRHVERYTKQFPQLGK